MLTAPAADKDARFYDLFLLFLIDLLLSTLVLTRRGRRGKNPEARNRREQMIDDLFPSEKLQKRFVERKMEDE